MLSKTMAKISILLTWIPSHCNKWSLSAHNKIALHLEALYSFVLTRGPDAGMPCKWLLGWKLVLQTHYCAVVAIIVSHGTMTTSQTCWLTRVSKRVSGGCVYSLLNTLCLLYIAIDFTPYEGDKKLSRTPSSFTFMYINTRYQSYLEKWPVTRTVTHWQEEYWLSLSLPCQITLVFASWFLSCASKWH